MLKHISIFYFVMIATACIVVLSSKAYAQIGHLTKEQFTQQLKKTMTRVHDEKTLNARTNAAERLADLTRGADPNNVDDKTLTDLISLLNFREDSVRFWVAASLGNLGPRAKVAVPKLLELLPAADCLNGSITSAATIREALKKIGATLPPSSPCKTQRIAG
jgi:hypothetical protein